MRVTGGRERGERREREGGCNGMLLLLIQVPGTQLFDHFILATKGPPPFILFPLKKFTNTYTHSHVHAHTHTHKM